MQKLYVGRRDMRGTARVLVIEPDGDSHWLNPRFDLCERCQPFHPGAGFEWGFDDFGPGQLALALLADALETADYSAMRYYRQFKDMCVVQMPHQGWSMTANTVCRYAVVIAIGESTHAATSD